MHTGFWWGNMKKHLEDLRMGRNNIKRMLWKWDLGGDRINVAQGSGRWWAFVNMVMNCQVTYNAWHF